MKLWEIVQASTEDALKKLRAHGRVDFELPSAALFSVADGWDPKIDRWTDPGQFTVGTPSIFQVKEPVFTSQNSVEYMQLTDTSTTGIAKEGKASAEQDLDYRVRNALISTSRGFLPITEEAYTDDDLLRGTVNSQLLHLARRRASRQLLAAMSGSNLTRLGRSSPRSPENPEPLYPTTDLLQAWADISREEAVPGFVVMYGPMWYRMLQEAHENNDPNVTGTTFYDRRVIEESQTGTFSDAANDTVWALTGPLECFDIAMRREAYIEVGHNDTDFTEFQLSLRVVVRTGLVLYRPIQLVRLFTAE